MEAQLKKHNQKLLFELCEFKSCCPDSLLVVGTWFTGMVIIGNLKINKNINKNYNHPHKDKKDMCTICMHIGCRVIGGEKQYFDPSG